MITTVMATIAGIILAFYFKEWQWSAVSVIKGVWFTE